MLTFFVDFWFYQLVVLSAPRFILHSLLKLKNEFLFPIWTCSKCNIPFQILYPFLSCLYKIFNTESSDRSSLSYPLLVSLEWLLKTLMKETFTSFTN